MLRKLLRLIGFGSVLNQLRANRESRRQELERDSWLMNESEKGSNIHSSLEFTGRVSYSNWNDLRDYVELGGSCILEKEITVWLSPDEGSRPSLSVKENVFVGRNSYIGVYQPIYIGNYVMIGAYSYIISANHKYSVRDMPIRKQGYSGGPIIIGDDVWLGTQVVILPGVTIGNGAIVAAGSIVNKNIPEYEIWGGAPAKFIKERP